MLSKVVSIAVAALTLVALVPAREVEAADYLGPSGWTKVDVSSTPTRTVSQWHLSGDKSSVTYVSDTAQSYADSLAVMTKNFSDNGIKPSVKDVPCHGTTAHIVEFKVGPDGSQTIFNRMLLAQGTGIVTVTYTRLDGNPFDDDVMKAENAYCM